MPRSPRGRPTRAPRAGRTARTRRPSHPPAARRRRRRRVAPRTPGSSFFLLEVAVLAREASKRSTQEMAPPRQARHDGADGAAEDLRHLLVREALEIGENDRLPEHDRQRLKGTLHVAVHYRLEELLLGVPGAPHLLGRALRAGL